MIKSSSGLKNQLEELYSFYNKREFVHPDPLEFLYRYSTIADREIAGLVASGLAYGRVNMILKSTETVLNFLGTRRSQFLKNTEIAEVDNLLSEFKHRFTAGKEMTAFLYALSSIQMEFGNAGNFLGDLIKSRSYLDALDIFSTEITSRMGCSSSHLIPAPSRGSACKRLHLFMRWMIRQDNVDPGGWSMIPASELIVPVDVHMYRIGLKLGFTKRGTADGKTAREITDGFKVVSSADPVKYDFALTRYGIQRLTECELFRELLQ